MPRLEQIVAHIANQSDAQNPGLDTQKISAYANTLSTRIDELSARQGAGEILLDEEEELEQLQNLQEKTEEFLEKERELKEALDARPRNQEAIRSAMRGAMQASAELDNMYNQLKGNYPESPAVTGAGEFDTLWQTETFEDAAETLTDIGNYRRSRVAQDIEEGPPADPLRGYQRRGRRGERFQYYVEGNDPADYIDENAEPEEGDIISAEDLKGKKRDASGRVDAPIALNLLSSQLINASRFMQNKAATDENITDEQVEQYSKLGDKLVEYSNAIDDVLHKNPDKYPDRIQESLKKISTLPAFLGQRNLLNKKTNYELTAKILDDNGSGRDLLDQSLVETSDFLNMNLDIRQLNPKTKQQNSLSTPDSSETPDVIVSGKGEDLFISLHPKEDLARGLAETTLRLENPNIDPTASQMNKRISRIKEMPMFKQLSKDPARMEKILKEKDFTGTMQSFGSPFSTCSTAKKKEVLEKLKMLKESGPFDSRKDRSPKWCNLMDSLDQINTNDPETYDQQLQSIFDKTEIYQKGKKAIGRDEGVNRRFSQSVNILGILAQAGDAAKDRCNVLVDRTNYVRTRWGRTQPTISLDPETLPEVKRINHDHSEIKMAGKDLYKRHQLKDNMMFDNYSLLKAMPDETVQKQPQKELNY